MHMLTEIIALFLFCFSKFVQNREAQALLPLTVKQISQALQPSTDAKAEFQVDGVGLSSVRIFFFRCGLVFCFPNVSYGLILLWID